jgi:hypothetical protein
MSREGETGWRSWRMIPRVAGGAIALPVVLGFVVLGAVVLVGRSVREALRDTWSRLAARNSAPDEDESDSHAA